MVLKPILPKTLLLLPLLLYACAAPQSPPPARTPPPSQTHGGASYPSPVVTSPHGQPASIALLLPLSGTFSATAESVRDGFFSAYFADISHPAARVYDVGRSQEHTSELQSLLRISYAVFFLKKKNKHLKSY